MTSDKNEKCQACGDPACDARRALETAIKSRGKPCPTCEGTGKLYGNYEGPDRCWNCGGTGMILEIDHAVLEKLFAVERVHVAVAMKNFGGAFVKSLGEALGHADMTNAYKIKVAFPEFWNEYKKIFERHRDLLEA